MGNFDYEEFKAQAIGNSAREISDMLEEQFGNRISADTISGITDRILPVIKSWRDNWERLTAYFRYSLT